MNYIGRKDGGSYISSEKETEGFDGSLLIPIAYNKEIADHCREHGQNYRQTYIEAIRELNK